MHKITGGESVDYSDMESYEKTLYSRPFDWGIKKILPKDKYNVLAEENGWEKLK